MRYQQQSCTRTFLSNHPHQTYLAATAPPNAPFLNQSHLDCVEILAYHIVNGASVRTTTPFFG